MDLSLRTLRFRLLAKGVLPRTRLARAACYLLGLDLLLFALQRLFGIFKVSYGNALSGWVGILGALAIVLLAILAYRWLKARLLWRLRNRLIVTYVFIGVIPVGLLVAMAFITIYLFAGQFANFVVTSELDSRLRSLQSVNAAIAHELAARLEHGQPAVAESLEGLKRNDRAWASRQFCAWKNGAPLAVCHPVTNGKTPFALPSFLTPGFAAIVRDQGQLYLRASTELGADAVRVSLRFQRRHPSGTHLGSAYCPGCARQTRTRTSPRQERHEGRQRPRRASPRLHRRHTVSRRQRIRY